MLTKQQRELLVAYRDNAVCGKPQRVHRALWNKGLIAPRETWDDGTRIPVTQQVLRITEKGLQELAV